MKTLIAAAVMIFAGNAANADYLSRFNPQEFYSGKDIQQHPVTNPGVALNNDNLFLEGHFPRVTPSAGGAEAGRVCDSDTPVELYMGAHWPI